MSATDSVKLLVRILTNCKNRVKTSYKQKKGQEAFKQHKKDSGRIREMRLGRVGSCRHLCGRIALQAKLSLLPAILITTQPQEKTKTGKPLDPCRPRVSRRRQKLEKPLVPDANVSYEPWTL